MCFSAQAGRWRSAPLLVRRRFWQVVAGVQVASWWNRRTQTADVCLLVRAFKTDTLEVRDFFPFDFFLKCSSQALLFLAMLGAEIRI